MITPVENTIGFWLSGDFSKTYNNAIKVTDPRVLLEDMVGLQSRLSNSIDEFKWGNYPIGSELHHRILEEHTQYMAKAMRIADIREQESKKMDLFIYAMEYRFQNSEYNLNEIAQANSTKKVTFMPLVTA